MLTTQSALTVVMPKLGGHAVICANGYISRWAHACGDHPGCFYMIGSMGLASSIGLGIAVASAERKVAVIDGDGNVLMNMGQLAMIAALRPTSFLHVVLDNGVYASTGNQRTIAPLVKLEAIAAAAGYARVERVREPDTLGRALGGFLEVDGPAMLLVETGLDSGEVAPRIPFTPPQMTARMQAFLGKSADSDGLGNRADVAPAKERNS